MEVFHYAKRRILQNLSESVEGFSNIRKFGKPFLRHNLEVKLRFLFITLNFQITGDR